MLDLVQIRIARALVDPVEDLHGEVEMGQETEDQVLLLYEIDSDCQLDVEEVIPLLQQVLLYVRSILPQSQ